MSKISIWVLVGIIFVGGGYYALNVSKNNNTNTLDNEVVVDTNQEDDTINTDATTEATPSGKKMAFSQFIATDKGSYECTVNQYVNDIESKGKVYINNGMIKGEFNTKTAGLSIDTSLIVRDGFTYTWSSMLPGVGFKAKVVADTNTNTDTKTTAQYSFNAEQIGDYDCQPWATDESKFILPTSIVFKEV
ncbi:MAG: hypothetical protein WC011_02635 [Candidatus Paceibacterota bacterium]